MPENNNDFMGCRVTPDTINRITIEYNHITKTAEDKQHFHEKISIDRTKSTLEHTQEFDETFTVNHTYKIDFSIIKLLDTLYTDEFFSVIEGNPLDIIINPNDTKSYTITVEYEKSPMQIIIGSFDKKGLPNDWYIFAKEVFSFIQYHTFSEILSPDIFGRARRRVDDLIYCSVEFEKDGKTYYFLTDSDEYEIDDYVIVPCGDDFEENIAKIVDVEYFDKENVPYPLEKMKSILRKCKLCDLVLNGTTAMTVPIGKISISINHKPCDETCFECIKIEKDYIENCYRIYVDVDENVETVSCRVGLDSFLVDVRALKGDNFLCNEYHHEQTLLAISVAEPNENLAEEYEITSNEIGFEYKITGENVSEVSFGISWVEDYYGSDDIRTWLASDILDD